MENSSSYYIDLISKHLDGETSPEEARLLFDWIRMDPENRKVFEEYRKNWNLIAGDRIEQKTDIDAEWMKFGSGIQPVEERVRGFRLPAFFSGSFITYSGLLRIAAVFLLAALPLFFAVRYFMQPGMNEVAAYNKITRCNLPDGTIVTLNQGAVFRFPEKFKEGTREVTLQGEAFFQVSHDKSKPFIITSGNVLVEVYGTAFYVNTNAGNNKMNVVLSTGSVAVCYQDSPVNKVFLEPGEKATINTREKEIITAANEDPNYLAWKTGILIFNGDPLSEVVDLLNKIYHSDIHLTGDAIADCRLNATFHGQSLQSVLNVIQATLDLRIKNSGTRIELSGDGCKQK